MTPNTAPAKITKTVVDAMTPPANGYGFLLG